MYGPWGYPPPCGPQMIQVPQGTDLEKFFKLLNHMEKKEAKRKAKEDEESKKKKEAEKKKTEPPKFTLMQVFMILMAFGLPVGGVNFLLMATIVEAIKVKLGL